jgi:hypothetical protein
MDDPRQLEQIINQLEIKIIELRKEYDLYFSGENRRPPEKRRNEVRKSLDKLRTARFRNTSMKYRLKSIQERFNAFCRLWDRTMFQIETGTYKPAQFRAEMRESRREKSRSTAPDAKGAAASGPRGAFQPVTDDESRMRNLYKTFIESRRVTGEKLGLSFDGFRNSIEKQSGTLRKKLGAEPDFKVVIESGKAKIKGFSRK